MIRRIFNDSPASVLGCLGIATARRELGKAALHMGNFHALVFLLLKHVLAMAEDESNSVDVPRGIFSPYLASRQCFHKNPDSCIEKAILHHHVKSVPRPCYPVLIKYCELCLGWNRPSRRMYPSCPPYSGQKHQRRRVPSPRQCSKVLR